MIEAGNKGVKGEAAQEQAVNALVEQLENLHINPEIAQKPSADDIAQQFVLLEVSDEPDYTSDAFIELMTKTPKKNLVLEGGGAKGIAYVGALQVLEAQGVLQGIERVAGSSAGGISAFLVALGFSVSEIDNIVSSLDLPKVLKDRSPSLHRVNSTVNAFNTTAKVLMPAYGLARHAIGRELPLEVGDAGVLFKSLVNAVTGGNNFDGPWAGKMFMEEARRILSDKLGNFLIDGKLTFSQLHALKETHPELGIKDLYLTGTDIDSNETVIFSHDNPETCHVDIIDALRATMSFPFAFKHHVIEINGVDRRFIDGGVLKNYPMDIFDAVDENSKRIPNPETIGFMVDSREECETVLFSDDIQNETKPIGKFIVKSQNGDVRHMYRYNTVQIFDADIDTLNFDLNELHKLTLKVSGARATVAYYADGYIKTPTNHDQVVNCLLDLEKALDNGAYLCAQRAIFNLSHLNGQLAIEAAKLSLNIIENWKTATTMRPGSTAEFDQLEKLLARIAQVELKDNGTYKAARDGSIGGVCGVIGTGALCVGSSAAAPIAIPAVILGGLVFGLCTGFGRANAEKKAHALKSLEVPLYLGNEQAFKEFMTTQIFSRNYEEAILAIEKNMGQLSLEDLEGFLKTLQSLNYKGFSQPTAKAYDRLELYLNEMIKFKKASTEVTQICQADQLEKLDF